jgi:hypothetical protein
MQMLTAGAVSSLAEARAVIDRSFPVTRYEPVNADHWQRPYERFVEYLELSCA